MIKIRNFILLIGVLVCTLSCQNEKTKWTELDKKSIIDSAKVTVQKVFELSNKLQFLDGLDYYAEDADAFYISNGEILSLTDLKSSYRQIGPSVEVLKNSIDNWHATLLSKNTVAFTLPIHLKIKLVGIPEYNGQLVWTGIVQKRNEKWVIIQSHESWLNCAEVISALSPSDININ